MSFNLQGFLLPEIRNSFPSPLLPCRYPPSPVGFRKLDFEGLIPLEIGFSTSCDHDSEAPALLAFTPSEAYFSTTVVPSYLGSSSYALSTCLLPQ